MPERIEIILLLVVMAILWTNNMARSSSTTKPTVFFSAARRLRTLWAHRSTCGFSFTERHAFHAHQISKHVLLIYSTLYVKERSHNQDQFEEHQRQVWSTRFHSSALACGKRIQREWLRRGITSNTDTHICSKGTCRGYRKVHKNRQRKVQMRLWIREGSKREKLLYLRVLRAIYGNIESLKIQ